MWRSRGAGEQGVGLPTGNVESTSRLGKVLMYSLHRVGRIKIKGTFCRRSVSLSLGPLHLRAEHGEEEEEDS